MARRVPLELVEVAPAGERAGPALLFVHGVRHGAWCWKEWQDRLAERGIRSWAVSLRGHGGSGGRVTGATLNAYVEDIVAAAERISEPVVLVGHSMGGLLVQRAVHRVDARGLALVASAPAHSGVPLMTQIARHHPAKLLAVIACRSLPVTIEDLVSADVSPADGAAIMAKIGRESALAQYQITMPRKTPARAPCPVLLFGSPDDRIIPVADVERCGVEQAVPVRWLPGLGHSIMLEPRGSEARDELADWALAL